MNWRDAAATFWLKNAMARHGVLPGDPTVTADAPAKTRSGLMPAILAAALTAAGLPIAGGIVSWYFGKTAETPPAATVEHDGSLYQYLEDHNLHLPE